MQPVVAPDHPSASLVRSATRGDLEPHVQLVLADPVDPGGAAYGVSSARLWRFVDPGPRLDFLLAGVGWCRMPEHLVAAAIAEAKLVALRIEDDPTPGEGLVIHAAHRRDRARPCRPLAPGRIATASRADLSALPHLGRAVPRLLAELPSVATGLGATEMQMPERVGRPAMTWHAIF